MKRAITVLSFYEGDTEGEGGAVCEADAGDELAAQGLDVAGNVEGRCGAEPAI
jgi:hypothetical protein